MAQPPRSPSSEELDALLSLTAQDNQGAAEGVSSPGTHVVAQTVPAALGMPGLMPDVSPPGLMPDATFTGEDPAWGTPSFHQTFLACPPVADDQKTVSNPVSKPSPPRVRSVSDSSPAFQNPPLGLALATQLELLSLSDFSVELPRRNANALYPAYRDNWVSLPNVANEESSHAAQAVSPAMPSQASLTDFLTETLLNPHMHTDTLQRSLQQNIADFFRSIVSG